MRKFFSLVIIVLSLGAIPLTTTVAPQQKTEVPRQQPASLAFGTQGTFNVHSGYHAQDGVFIDLTATGLSSVPISEIQLTQLLTPLLPVRTHRPFT